MTDELLKPPVGLANRGRSAWKDLTSRYRFRRDELEVLRELCRALDRIELLAKELRGEPLMIQTQRDGWKCHPLIQESRQQAKLAADLGRQLHLKVAEAIEEDGATPLGRWSSRSHRREPA